MINSGFATLSSNNPNNYDEVEGLLYVPTLSNNTPCASDPQNVIPQNVTRTSSFPPDQNYALVAYFPWTEPACVQAYLSVCRADGVRGAVVFQENRGAAPAPGDPVWSLGDGGNWKSQNQFPVYAIPSYYAFALMGTLAQVSTLLGSYHTPL